ncbi:MAG TPA: redoxin domain-containing protein [Flavobacteriales bacterium]|nr:redoxin domain-containing protein [Flavobacteriales bacterium]
MNKPLISLILLFLPLSSLLSFHKTDKREELTVYVFLSETCPICQSITTELKQIDTRFRGEGVKLVGLFPSPKISTEESRKKFAKKYQLSFPLLSDSSHTFTQKYQATITPEVVVVNDVSGEIIYRGLVDNSFASVGKRRRVVSEHYLLDILQHYYAGTPSTITSTQPVGCIIQQ